MCYLNQPDKIILGDVYSCGLKFAASKEIFSKNTTQIFNFISRYFDEKVRDSPNENHLIYFRFLEELFSSYWLNSKYKKELIQFFSKYSSYLKPFQDFQYSLLLKEYVDEIDLTYLINKLSDEKINSRSSHFSILLERINNVKTQKEILNIFLIKLGYIDTYEKFQEFCSIFKIS